ncbi:MAG TPA: ANTAR domain-containing protein [Acidimicrobiales bacterium]|nr:ANTAR domain-containing protein [Acidimicrobiales bacterium]
MTLPSRQGDHPAAALLDFASDAYLETDGVGRIERSNASSALLFGVDGSSLEGALLSDFVADGDRPVLRRTLDQLADTSAPVTVEFGVTPVERPEVRVEGTLVAGGGRSILCWLVRDRSAGQATEYQLRRLTAELELLDAVASVNRLAPGTAAPVESVVYAVTDLAMRACQSVAAAVVLCDEHLEVEVAAVTDPALDDLGRLGGPLAERARRAVATGAPVFHRVGDGTQEDGAADAALARVAAHWSLFKPIAPDGTGPGVLCILGRGPEHDSRRLARLLARHAGAALGNASLYAAATAHTANLEHALESRSVIEQAKGVLMAWQGCDEVEAFEILRRASQRANRKVRVLAAEVVARAASGERTDRR